MLDAESVASEGLFDEALAMMDKIIAGADPSDTMSTIIKANILMQKVTAFLAHRTSHIAQHTPHSSQHITQHRVHSTSHSTQHRVHTTSHSTSHSSQHTAHGTQHRVHTQRRAHSSQHRVHSTLHSTPHHTTFLTHLLGATRY